MVGGVVLVASMVATLPFLISGIWTRSVIESLPDTALATGVPVGLDGMVYQQGLYHSRFSFQLILPATDGAALFDIDGRVEHHPLGAQVVTTMTNHDWAARLFGPIASVTEDQPKLVTDLHIEPDAGWSWVLQSTLSVPAFVVTEDTVGFEIRQSPLRATIESDTSNINIEAQLSTLSVATQAIRESVWSGLRVEISGPILDQTQVLHLRDEVVVAVGIDAANIRVGPLVISLDSLAIEGRLGTGENGFVPNIVLTANAIESLGVPYVRLGKLQFESSGQARPPVSDVDDSQLASAPSFDLHQTFSADSNFGPIDIEIDVEAASWPLSRFNQADTAIDLQVMAPKSFVKLILEHEPSRAECWWETGVLVDEGERVSAHARWLGGNLVEPNVECGD